MATPSKDLHAADETALGPMPGKRGLDAIGLTMVVRQAKAPPDPIQVARSALAEALDVALAMGAVSGAVKLGAEHLRDAIEAVQ